ncbi:MAG: secondary thiamine-phosphate synthase enzyme YjbQ [Methylobacillus sp.]|jgi:secondary thiamine-phosphate synthase enzyme|nr:secondary thiamine-phosphate synthase enzyme YjbQ [Methylobacillus sp.]
MRQLTSQFTITTQGRKLYDITTEVTRWVRQTEIATGMLTLYIQHTSASLLINENCDPDVIADLERFFARLVPDGDPLFAHVDEGSDDMPAHVRAALTQTHLCIPVLNGKPALGTWQGIFLYEHRRASHQRRVLLHLIGDE